MISKRKIKINSLNSNDTSSIKDILRSRNYQIEENINEHESNADVMFFGADLLNDNLTVVRIRNGYKFPIVFATNNNTIDSLNSSDIIIQRPLIQENILKTLDEALYKSRKEDYINEDRRQLIIEESSEDACNFIRKFLEINHKKTCLISTTTLFNVKKLECGKYNSIINLKRINDAPRINKLLEEVNTKLVKGSKFIGCAETLDLRKRRIYFKYLPILNKIYYFFDFILKRLFPKLPITKQIYFKLTSGRNRALSKAEVLGRLYSCGFKVIDTHIANGLFYFVAEKEKEPSYDINPSYGPIFTMKRISKNGEIINVYKMRTMYPYSEFI